MNRIHKFLLYLLLVFLFPVSTLYAQGKDKLHVTVSINNSRDTVLFLANYYGDKQFIQDTGYARKNGKFLFEADTSLPGGLYIITGQTKERYFDFVLGKDQQFKLHTDTTAYTAHMKVSGSKENALFFEYVGLLNARQKEASELQQQLSSGNNIHQDSLQKELDQISEEVQEIQQDMMENHQGSFTAKFIKASQQISLPDSITSDEAYKYVQSHYFDNMELADSTLLRTPVYHQKLMNFLDKYTYQQPDSIINAVDGILAQARENKETYQYVLWELTRKYESSKIMGFDKIFVHLVDEYFNRERIDWLDQKVLKNLIERADEIRPLLLGKKAPDMMMLNAQNQPQSLYDINKPYTLIVFWDTDCGHCTTELPKLKRFYDKHADTYGLEVYAICTDNDLEAWRNYINEKNLEWINVHGKLNLGNNFHSAYDIYSTPTFYLLNKEKRIIAKRILTEQLEKILKYRR